MTTPLITTPVATSKNMSCNINMPWFVQGTEYCPTEATFEPLVNGERAFGAVYDAIMAAKQSVEIICWGFQPSMYFKRGDSCSLCIGELLALKAQEGVQVKVLCWYDSTHMAQSMENPTPGDNVSNWAPGLDDFFHATSISKELGFDRVNKKLEELRAKGEQNRNKDQIEIDKLWYRQVRLAYTGAETGPIELGQRFFRVMGWADEESIKDTTLQFVTRDFSVSDRVEIAWRLAMEALDQDRSKTNKVMSTTAMFLAPTHHQKMVLVDYEKPELAVGFVMGHNTLDAYWDKDDHAYERMAAQKGRNGATPRQDISSRVTGPILEYLNQNFCEAWEKETHINLLPARKHIVDQLKARQAYGTPLMAQILRTRSQSNVRDIEKLYLKAVNNTTQFIYIENQYFRWPPLAEKIKSVVQNLLDGGRDLEVDGPVYLFVVTNSSNEGMGDGSVNTFRMLKQLGRPELLPGVARAERHDELMDELYAAKQEELLATQKAAAFNQVHGIDHTERAARIYEPLKNKLAEARAKVARLEQEMPEKDAEIVTPSEIEGLKIHICTLVAPDSPPNDWMDVYVHSKLMIVDDVFTTIGSANINTRSMQVDTELNICVEDPSVTKPLREHLFDLHIGKKISGLDTTETYQKWQEAIDKNKSRRTKGMQDTQVTTPDGPIASLVEFLQESSTRKNLD
ncbi:phospholipase D-like domain-containing protein [Pseudomonas syringae pv. syringae]|uniref:phospholipase D-like domain-containing protein n=1 Tax=Pseudomonas syringae TaxID=317 RepID=UPI001F0E6DFC|nr:phospholipase D-like domain-containing protein [Pseudomonas syringae]MCH5551888.1 phospholipase D-like domain-containing protein [Pseudomonas syringae pv. syringae]